MNTMVKFVRSELRKVDQRSADACEGAMLRLLTDVHPRDTYGEKVAFCRYWATTLSKMSPNETRYIRMHLSPVNDESVLKEIFCQDILPFIMKYQREFKRIVLGVEG